MVGTPPQIDQRTRFLPSPSPDEIDHVESHYISALEFKRKDLSEQVEVFKQQKEKEFRLFEEELHSRKTRKMDRAQQRQPSPTASFRGLLKAGLEGKKKGTSADKSGLRPNLGPSRPSVSIDLVTINGMTTPPISSTPPLTRALSRSPTTIFPATPPPSAKEIVSVKEGEDNINGLFTAAYFDSLANQKPSSLPDEPTARPISVSKRSRTTPTSQPSSSLPSALRTANDRTRKRKHVTFKLAHSVVVNPSSSYEEAPRYLDSRDEVNLDGENHEMDDLGNSGTDTSSTSVHIQIPRSVADRLGKLPITTMKPASPESDFFDLDEDFDHNEDEMKYRSMEDDEVADAASDSDDFERGSESPLGLQEASPTFSAGSLPINIVRTGQSFPNSIAITT